MFTKVLIANRGEIACRIIRTLKKMGIGSVAVYSDPDATAAHVLLADEAVRIGPAAPAESYLNMEAILCAARQTGAQAIHPGYGFLSENAAFAGLCAENGIEFIGPTPEQLVDFGLKHKARELAERWNVPLVPGSGLLDSVEAAKTAAESIGYPVMLKSTAGGGGIGMCICRSEDELEEGFERIGRLSRNHFKDSGLFVEKYIERARHVEVQIFGDGKGGIAVLGERDCSVQRRNQKVIEETPAPNLPAPTRNALHEAASRLGRGVAYRSAGTVEFIYDGDADRFYFLEVNTRLQVEHGVTEAVFGIDLVEWMVKLAAGEIPFRSGGTFLPDGAAMEFRVYAEDPGKNYQPSSGLVTQADFPDGIRCDTWLSAGTEVSAFYDPLLAKIIVKGCDRDEVIRKAEKALRETKIAGFETNLLLLRDVLAEENFRKGSVSTRLLKDYHYSAPTIEILAPGAQTTVQDYPGRLGYWAVGVPPSGPMDAYSFRLANRIVGNAPDAPGLEMTLSGASLRFNTDALFTLTGGEFPATLNGQEIRRNIPLKANRGDTLKIGVTRCGQRCYFAVAGGIDVPEYLGSRSTFTLGRFGGHGGRALAAGDILHIGNWKSASPLIPAESVLPEIGNSWKIAVLYGPHGAPDYFTDNDIRKFFDAEWEVHYNSSRTGIRLIGPQPEWARPDGGEAGLHPSNLHDNAYAVGTIDFTGDMPVILGKDGPSLGGFVCPATVITADLWKIGQLRSGDKVRFIPVSPEQAAALRMKNEARLENPAEEDDTAGAVAEELRSPVLAEFHKENEQSRIVCRQDGDAYLLLEFGPPILDLRLRFVAHAWMLKLEEMHLPAILDITPGIRSIQIHFDPALLDQKELLRLIGILADKLKEETVVSVPTRTVYLPLSWDDPATRLAIRKYVSTVRPDAPWCCPNNIEFIRRINGLDSIDEVAKIVFDANYIVMGLGDVYLGAPVATPLDPRRRLVTTKYNPARTWTPENAVGIGGAYMCVYGMEGPGGYQFVGRTVQMWNRFRVTAEFEKGKPYLLRFFDQVRFYPVTADELLKIRRDFIAGNYHLRMEKSTFDIREYEKFLEENADSIHAFEVRRTQAFNEEKSRWIANGQLSFESHPVLSSDSAEEVVLSAEETGIYSPVAGSLWKLNVVEPGTQVRAGEVFAVLESMKTEIPIPADSDCEVTQVFCSAGTEVKSGQCLFAVKTK